MEAGGFDNAKANIKAVVVIRQGADGKTTNYTLNLKLVLEGKDNEPFYLKPSDIVVVPGEVLQIQQLAVGFRPPGCYSNGWRHLVRTCA